MKHLYYPSGKLYAAFSDRTREYFYEDGTLKTFETPEQSVLYYPNGNLKRKCHFANGQRDGIDQMWDENGLLADEGSYEKGKPVGIHRRFKKGKLIEEIEYLGPFRFNLREWDEQGEIRIEAVWSDLDYKERIWDRFQNIWVEKEGYWNGKKLVYV